MRLRQKQLFAALMLSGLTSLGGCSSPAPISDQRVNITIKAGIVYRMGGPQPVARTNFYLTKEDLIALAQKTDTNAKIGILGAMSNYEMQLRGNATTVENLAKTNAVSTATTDFEGNGKFQNVLPGAYYLIGVTQTRGGVAIWSLAVNATENVTLILDQNNAAYTS